MKFYILFSLFLTVQFSYSQTCTGIISPTSIHISSGTTITTSDQAYWICSTLIANTGGIQADTFYLEENVTLNLNGSGHLIYAQDFSTINSFTTNSTYYLGDFVTLNLNGGGGNTIYVAGNNVTINGIQFGNTINTTACTEVSLDYSNAPGGDCSSATQKYLELSNSCIKVFECPVGNNVTIEGSLALYLLEVRLLNGSLKCTIPSVGTSQTVILPVGSYLIVVNHLINPDLRVQLLLTI